MDENLGLDHLVALGAATLAGQLHFGAALTAMVTPVIGGQLQEHIGSPIRIGQDVDAAPDDTDRPSDEPRHDKDMLHVSLR